MSINFKVIFGLDGTGMYHDPYEPIHLDALIVYALAPFYNTGEPPSKEEQPMEIPLPLQKWTIGDHWGWKASVLLPEVESPESLQYFRRKFRQNKMEITEGNPNLIGGPYCDRNIPVSLTLCHKMVAYAVGDRHEVEMILKKYITYLGKRRNVGKGRLLSIETETIDDDYSMIQDGKAMRTLPKADGLRLCRVRPPYWNTWDRLNCCEIGEEYDVPISNCN